MTGFSSVAAVADNLLTYPEGRSFAAIIGANPSKGARSPILWNAAFKAHGVDAEMLAIDVPGERLIQLLTTVDVDKNFIGGAIAMPHKESVARWLGDRLTPEARLIGAVNCLFRGPDGRLMGTNTDGEGALVSFERRFGSLLDKTVFLMGPGGAGKAVAAFSQRALGAKGRLMITGRSEVGKQYTERLGCDWVAWRNLAAAVPLADVLINCTSVGSGKNAGETPIPSELLALLPDHAAVFDIIYQPTPSMLLTLAAERGLPVLDGTGMNLEQAVLAFGYAAPQPKGKGVTRDAMEQIKQAWG